MFVDTLYYNFYPYKNNYMYYGTKTYNLKKLWYKKQVAPKQPVQPVVDEEIVEPVFHEQPAPQAQRVPQAPPVIVSNIYVKYYKYLEANNDKERIKLWNKASTKERFRFNRIKNSKKTIEECPICYENNVVGIDIECGANHFICLNCLSNVNNCPFGCGH